MDRPSKVKVSGPSPQAYHAIVWYEDEDGEPSPGAHAKWNRDQAERELPALIDLVARTGGATSPAAADLAKARRYLAGAGGGLARERSAPGGEPAGSGARPAPARRTIGLTRAQREHELARLEAEVATANVRRPAPIAASAHPAKQADPRNDVFALVALGVRWPACMWI